jgi:RHS repeat-associated protein
VLGDTFLYTRKLVSGIEKKDLVDSENSRRYYYNYNLPRFVICRGWQVLCEYNGGGSYQKMFIYGNYIDEVLYTQGTSPATRRYYVHDHLYSPVALVYAGTAAVIERYEYDAYGNPTIWNADFTTERESSNYGNPYLFTGRRTDYLDSGSLKIQYNRNRYYDYYSGRWLTHDPLGITPNPQKTLNKILTVTSLRRTMSV